MSGLHERVLVVVAERVATERVSWTHECGGGGGIIMGRWGGGQSDREWSMTMDVKVTERMWGMVLVTK